MSAKGGMKTVTLKCPTVTHPLNQVIMALTLHAVGVGNLAEACDALGAVSRGTQKYRLSEDDAYALVVLARQCGYLAKMTRALP